MASVEGHGTREERIISVHGRGRFLGELSLLTGEGSFYTAMALDAGEVLAVSVARLRELIASDPAFGDLVLRAYLLRRSILIGLGVGLRVVGSRYSPDTRRVRDFAARNRIPVRWLDLETDPAAEAMLAQFGLAPDDTPIVIVYGRLLRNPGNAELAAAIGLPAPSAQQAGCDMLVVGAGPAGLSAAVYAASEGMQVTALDGVATGGQAGTSSRIENYLGFPSGISGAELADRAMLQAEKFGARFAVPAEAAAIAQESGYYRVHLTDGTSLTSTSVVIATGARYRRLDVPRLDYFEKMSVYYAASQAEALMCARRPGRDRRRRQLGRAGGDLPFRPRHPRHAHRPRARPERAHVALPHRPGHAAPERGGHGGQRGAGTARRPGRWRRSPSPAAVPARGASFQRARSSSSSGLCRAQTGWAAWLTLTTTDLSGPGPVRWPQPAVRAEPGPCHWRPVGPASSPSAMSAAARPNESPRPSARARWPSGSPSKEPGQRRPPRQPPLLPPGRRVPVM